MAESFSVGEIAIFKHDGMARYDGQEVEVFSVTGCNGCGRSPHGRYGIRAQDGHRLCVDGRTLRKRRPPQDWVKLCNLTDVPREVAHV